MYKKSLAAVAVLGAFAANAMAADVTLYGVVDYGMQYKNQEVKTTHAGETTKKTTDALTLDSGVNAGSRFGIKATEDLGNGYKVSFKLENGFDADDGELGQSGRLFGREASLSVSSDWGTLSAGRMGAVTAAAGTYDFMAIVDAFDGGDGEINGLFGTSRMDNMLVYQSPKVAGLQLTAEYSFKADNKTKFADPDQRDTEIASAEGHKSAQRYAGLALTGEYGPFQGLVAYEQVIQPDWVPAGAQFKDAKYVTVGGNYDCGFAKTFVTAQYLENVPYGAEENEFGLINVVDTDALDGYALHLGTQFGIGAGTLTTGVYYNDMTSDKDPEASQKYIGGSVKYEYPLSVRTSLYSSVGYAKQKWESTGEDEKTSVTQAYFGITHAF